AYHRHLHSFPTRRSSDLQVSGWQIPTARRDQRLTQTIVGVCFRKQLWSLGPERRNAPVFSPPLGVGLTRKRSERADSCGPFWARSEERRVGKECRDRWGA